MAVIRANSEESLAQLCSDPSDCPVHNQLSLSKDPHSCLTACLKKKNTRLGDLQISKVTLERDIFV